MSVAESSTLSSVDITLTADSLALSGTSTVNISSITSNEVVVSAAQTVITILGPNVPVPTIFVTGTVTADVPSNDPLQTPSCTTPYFAVVTDRAQAPLQYPQVGCSLWHEDCCLYSFRDSVLLKGCPPDFVTRSRDQYTACCPPEFDLLHTGIGRQTPCYSLLSIPYVPATTVTDLDRRLITDTVFALSYPLAPPHKLPVGAIVGGVLGGLFLLTLGILLLCWRGGPRRPHPPSSKSVACRQTEFEVRRPQPPRKSHPIQRREDQGYYGRDPDNTTYHIDWPPGYHASQQYSTTSAAELPALGSQEHPSLNLLPLEPVAPASPEDDLVNPDDVISPLSWEKDRLPSS